MNNIFCIIYTNYKISFQYLNTLALLLKTLPPMLEIICDCPI